MMKHGLRYKWNANEKGIWNSTMRPNSSTSAEKGSETVLWRKTDGAFPGFKYMFSYNY
jgi:hypothetical protein